MKCRLIFAVASLAIAGCSSSAATASGTGPSAEPTDGSAVGFAYDGTTPATPASGVVYRFTDPECSIETNVANIAESLGLAAEVQQLDGGGWQARGPVGSLDVAGGIDRQWSYSPPFEVITTGCLPGVTGYDIDSAPPPSDAPLCRPLTETEIDGETGQATAVFTASGLDLGRAQLKATNSLTGHQVTGRALFDDDIPSSYAMTVSFSPAGVITGASGYLGRLIPVGPAVTLLTIDSAVAALNDPTADTIVLAVPGCADRVAVGADSSGQVETDGVCAERQAGPVTFDQVEYVSASVQVVDDLYLIPAYRMTAPDGASAVVAAIDRSDLGTSSSG